MKIKKIISIAILTALSSSITYASQEVYELYTVREKALGATTVANTKNSHQFNRNSALLSYKENFSLAFPKISFGISTDYVDNYETLEDLMDATKPLSEQMEDLKSLVPMDFSINAGIHPGLSVTMPNFGIKLYGTSQIAAKLLRKSSPTLYLAGSQSTIIQAGFSKEFFINNHLYSLGISPKYIVRNTIYDKTNGNDEAVFTQSEILQHINEINEQELDFYEANGFGLDIGFSTKYTFKNHEGIFGINAQNLISNLSGDKEVNDVNQSVTINDPIVVTVGTNTYLNLPILKKVVFATDYNIVAPTQNAFKRFHLGLEKNLYSFIKLRGGINQGFIVGGASINFYILKLDYAFFGEELSSTLGNNSLLTHNLKLSLIF